MFSRPFPRPFSSFLILGLLGAVATLSFGASSRSLAAPPQQVPNCNVVITSITGAVAAFNVDGDGTTMLSVTSSTNGNNFGISAAGVGAANNASVAISAFVPPTFDPVTITASQIDPGQPASGSVTVTDSRAGPADRQTITINFVLVCTSEAVDGCTYTIGFWKNHPAAWPVSSLTLGTVTYSKAQLLSILKRPVRGNGLVALAHQLIAAKLNIENGASAPSNVVSDIAAADALIGSLVVPPVGSGSLGTNATAPLVQSLDLYNNGLAVDGPPHCE
jgi:hypothetical protein